MLQVHTCGRAGVVYCHRTLSFVYPALQEGGSSPAAFTGYEQRQIRCVGELMQPPGHPAKENFAGTMPITALLSDKPV